MPHYGDPEKEKIYEQVQSALYGVEGLKGLKTLAEIVSEGIESYESHLQSDLQDRQAHVKSYIRNVIRMLENNAERSDVLEELNRFLEEWDLQR